jgi:hypothetical protein
VISSGPIVGFLPFDIRAGCDPGYLQLCGSPTREILTVAMSGFHHIWDVLPYFGAAFGFVDNVGLVKSRGLRVQRQPPSVNPGQSLKHPQESFAAAIDILAAVAEQL